MERKKSHVNRRGFRSEIRSDVVWVRGFEPPAS